VSYWIHPEAEAELEEAALYLAEHASTALAEARNDSKVLVYIVLARAGAASGAKTEDENMVSSTAYCFVKGKVVMLVTYRQFKSPKDLQASRSMVESWANALVAAN